MKYQIEVKNCPHCGKQSELIVQHRKAYIICSDHNCLGGISVEWGSMDNPNDYIDKMVNDWNSRDISNARNLLQVFYDKVKADLENNSFDSDYDYKSLGVIEECINKLLDS